MTGQLSDPCSTQVCCQIFSKRLSAFSEVLPHTHTAIRFSKICDEKRIDRVDDASALTFRDFVPRLELFTLFRDLGIFGKVWMSVKWTISVYFGYHIWFCFQHLWRPTWFDLKILAPKVCKINFMEVIPRKDSRENIFRKSDPNFFRASLGKFGQKSFAPPNICLLLYLWYTYEHVRYLSYVSSRIKKLKLPVGIVGRRSKAHEYLTVTWN